MAKSKNTALAAFKSGLGTRRKGKHRKTKMTLPLAVVAGFVPLAVGVWNRRSSLQSVADYLQSGLTGVSPGGQFQLSNLRQGLVPIVAGFLVHSLAGRLGINRSIGRAGIPFIRI